MPFNQTEFGKRVKEMRIRAGMTQGQLAERLGITREHIGRIERGRYGCSIDLLLELSCTLNVSADYLLTGKAQDHDQEREQLLAIISQLTALVQKM